MLFSSTASFVTAVDGKVRFPAAEQNSEVHPRDETLSGEAADCVAQLFISQSPWQVQTKYLPFTFCIQNIQNIRAVQC